MMDLIICMRITILPAHITVCETRQHVAFAFISTRFIGDQAAEKQIWNHATHFETISRRTRLNLERSAERICLFNTDESKSGYGCYKMRMVLELCLDFDIIGISLAIGTFGGDILRNVCTICGML